MRDLFRCEHHCRGRPLRGGLPVSAARNKRARRAAKDAARERAVGAREEGGVRMSERRGGVEKQKERDRRRH